MLGPVRLRSRSSTVAAKVFGVAIRGAFLGRANRLFFHRGPLADAEAPALPITPEGRERPTPESSDVDVMVEVEPRTLVREDTPTTTTEREEKRLV